jgi:hypothetical protein
MMAAADQRVADLDDSLAFGRNLPSFELTVPAAPDSKGARFR